MEKKHNSYWIIGAGKFGVKAAERLHKKRPEASLTVVDQDASALDRLDRLPVERVCKEGASYLEVYLDTQIVPDWIIPAVPIHLAFEWVRLKLSIQGRVEACPVPQDIEKMLPNPIRGSQGQLYVSYADFLCPDNCTEPFDRCTFTGKPRKGLLFKRIEEISYKDYRSIVVRSHQLAPGVGGYQPEALKRSLVEVSKSEVSPCFRTGHPDCVTGRRNSPKQKPAFAEAMAGHHAISAVAASALAKSAHPRASARGILAKASKTPVLYSTACLCHGVVHAFNLVQRI